MADLCMGACSLTGFTRRAANYKVLPCLFDGEAALSPIDRWTFELPLEDTPCSVSFTSADTKQHDLVELADTFLILEHKVKDE
ncbi:MAG TPA: hypothetical protein VK452_08150 [Dissulfurispiraceae bacterium]|nr:hypothetical protein [Dissulfurispiraceae bacterium]